MHQGAVEVHGYRRYPPPDRLVVLSASEGSRGQRSDGSRSFACAQDDGGNGGAEPARLETLCHQSTAPSLRGGRRPTRQSMGSHLLHLPMDRRGHCAPSRSRVGRLKFIKSREPRCAVTDRRGTARLEALCQLSTTPVTASDRRERGSRASVRTLCQQGASPCHVKSLHM